MKAIARVQTTDRTINQLQSNIITGISQVIINPILDGTTLVSVPLVIGDNIVNHMLDRTLQGWFIVRQRASATIFDKQDSNATPDKTLVLNASGAVTLDIYVY